MSSYVAQIALVDHHCHGVTRNELDRAGFEKLITESSWPPPDGGTHFDSQVGFAIRRWCAPVLALEAHASPEAYLARRRELGSAEVTRRLLRATGTSTYLVETGHGGPELLTPEEMAVAAGARARTVVRLERVAEELFSAGGDLVAGYPAALAQATRDAVGLKSIICYRHGLDFDPVRPSPEQVAVAVDRWSAQTRAASGHARLTDPVLLRHVLWAGVDTGLPIQVHVGYGDATVNLYRSNPLLMTDWLRMVRPLGTRIALLHCYPYHREAGYLAHVFPHVYFDVGLAINYTGARSAEIIAESLELAPFTKVLYSSDAFGVPELHHLGALLFRRGLDGALGRWVERGDVSAGDAARVAQLIGTGNACRLYGLVPSSPPDDCLADPATPSIPSPSAAPSRHPASGCGRC